MKSKGRPEDTIMERRDIQRSRRYFKVNVPRQRVIAIAPACAVKVFSRNVDAHGTQRPNITTSRISQQEDAPTGVASIRP